LVHVVSPPLARQRALVTGGAGFIGSNIVASLCATGEWDVIVCDWFGKVSRAGAPDDKWLNLAKHPIADIVAPERLLDWLAENHSDLDVVIHMGAISSTTEPDVDLILRTNFMLSRDLWEFCGDHAIRLIWASSAATYGAGVDGEASGDPDDLASLEALRPLNPYGWSKALFDAYTAREVARGFHPPQHVGLKFFNVYGPNEWHKGDMMSVATQCWPDVVLKRGVTLFTPDNPDYPNGAKRDFIYVLDVANVVLWLLENEDVNGIFNLGTGRAR